MGESQPLLGGEAFSVFNKRQPSNVKRNLSYLLNVLTICTIIYLYVFGTKPKLEEPESFNPQKKKNVIMMVTDGCGPASYSLARSFRQFRDRLPMDDILTIDKYLVGTSRTRSSSSLVTDSAAGATAFSCALKSYNGAIGVDSSKRPCGTILEALKLQGYLTGLVVTTRITDATPAAFSSHANYRFQEDLIAQHQLGEYPFGRAVDLILGGGRCHFLPVSKGGCRLDNRDLIREYEKEWSYIGNRQAFDSLNEGKNVTLPLLGLIANTDIPYEIDREDKKHPSLAEQVKVALNALSEATENSEQGFFLLIEGSRIDHAGHHNDPAAQAREVLAYDKAFEEVIKFIDSTDVDTIAISTSDHETGGLVTARQVTEDYPDYLWYPEVLLNSTHSGDFLAHKIFNFKDKHDVKSLTKFIKQEIFEKDMGILNYSEKDVNQVLEKANDPANLLYVLNNVLSIKAQIGWTTKGHSAVDVDIFAHTNSKTILEELKSFKTGLYGNHENIEIGQFMEFITGSNLEHVTDLIKETNSKSTDFSADEYHKGNRYNL